MNENLRNRISEVIGANNISYILNENRDFSVTGYKVMQNQGSAGLLKCAKIMYNGKIKLVYIVEGYKPLSYVATRLGVTELNAVIFNLIQRAIDIKSNGFFRAENIELDFNKIFVDTSDYSVHLIYFPVSDGVTGKISSFESEFRIALINLFNSFPAFSAPHFQRLCSDLANGSLPFDVILKKMQDNINGNGFNNGRYEVPSYDVGGGAASDYYSYGSNASKIAYQPPTNLFVSHYTAPSTSHVNSYQGQMQNNPSNHQNYPGSISSVMYDNASVTVQPPLTVSTINSPVQLTLTVTEPEYLIGKMPSLVNGAVTHNPAISRVHCKISFSNGHYYITDMGSANGTTVNHQRLEKQQMVEIRSGDYLKLANSEFIINF